MLNYTFFHGSALVRIVQDSRTKGASLFYDNDTYLINENTAIYMKHSTSRLSPWQFSFHQEHTDRVNELENKCKKLFIALICYDDGICCLSLDEYRKVIHEDDVDNTKSIRISRLRNEKYKVTGSDGKLAYKIGNSHFPDKIFQQ